MQAQLKIVKTDTGAAPVRPTPARIMDISWGLARTGALVAALDLDLFSLVAAGRSTAAEVAQAANVSLRGAEALLLAMAAVGLLVPEQGGRYALADDARTYLVRGVDSYLGDLRHVYHRVNTKIWPQLTESVRSGSAPKDLFADDDAGWDPILPYLDALGTPAAIGIATLLAKRMPDAANVLDVGCGTGLYGQTIARTNAGARVTGLDREQVLVGARARAAALGLSDRVQYEAGDLRTMSWGAGRDAVVMSHVLHGYDPDSCQGLLARAKDCLRPGGILVLNEFVPNTADPTQTVMQALFGLQMVLTSSGAAYGFEQYASWAAAAGFRDLEQLPAPAGPSSYVIARS